MINLSVTGILNSYKIFSRDFWLSYKALEKLMDPFKFADIKLNLMKTKRIDDKFLQDVDKTKYELEKQLIDAEWKQKSDDAKLAGIALHDAIHNMFCTDLNNILNNFGVNLKDYRVIKTELFLNTEHGLFPEFRMEVKLSEEYTLVGIADLIIKEGNEITIIDWKSNDKITTRSHFDLGKKKAKCFSYPLSKFEDCDLILYQMLLSLYGWMILQLDPNLKINTLKIIQIKDFKTKNIYCVDYLKSDMEKLIKWHIKNIKMKEEMNKCKESKFI